MYASLVSNRLKLEFLCCRAIVSRGFGQNYKYLSFDSFRINLNHFMNLNPIYNFILNVWLVLLKRFFSVLSQFLVCFAPKTAPKHFLLHSLLTIHIRSALRIGLKKYFTYKRLKDFFQKNVKELKNTKLTRWLALNF